MNKKILSSLAVITTLGLGAPAAQAQDPGRPFRFFLGVAATGGGDELVTARYSNGDTYTLRAGNLINLQGGLEIFAGPVASVMVSAGYHFDHASARNGSITFSRVPIEAVGSIYLHPRFRLGAGIRYTANPRLSGDRFGSDLDESYKAGLGPVLEAEFFATPWLGIRVRGVSEKFKAKNAGPDIKGDHVGVGVNFYF